MMLNAPALVPLPNPFPAVFGADSVAQMTALRRLVWLYFWLLIVEGALRKWIFPGLANPLLIVRDPVVIAIYVVALSQGVFPRNSFIWIVGGLAFLSTLASAIVGLGGGRGTWLITLYGLRTNFLHLPLLFLLPRIFSAQQVQRLGKWLLILSIPMAFLVVAQFRAAPDALVNAGVGGNLAGGGQLEVGFGKIRPPGTFSFNTGLFAYLALTSAYLLNAFMQKKALYGKWALIALPAVGAMIAVSGSRSTLATVAIILVGVLFICLRQPVFFGKAIKGCCFVGLVYFALSFWSEFRFGLLVHETRLVTGGGLEHGLILRFLGDLAAPLKAATETPILGLGLGMGTNVAGGLLTGERNFLLAEGEWERVVRESGAILGFAYIFLRLGFLAYLASVTLKALSRQNPLPVLILCAALPQILNGQFGVPTTLGFAVFMGGLTLAAAREGEEELPVFEPAPFLPDSPRMRGRSPYSQQLHGC